MKKNTNSFESFDIYFNFQANGHKMYLLSAEEHWYVIHNFCSVKILIKMAYILLTLIDVQSN